MGALSGAMGTGGGGAGTSIVRATPTFPGTPAMVGGGAGGRGIGTGGPGTIFGVPIMAPGYGFGGKLRGRIAPTQGGCPRGWHLNKHQLADGTAPRTICVRNRHMNPLNPRALKRALMREKRAGKIIKRLHIFRPVHRAAPTTTRFLPRKK